MVKNLESLSQRVSEMLLRELRNRNYSALPVNVGGKDNSWDIEKIIVTKNGRDICDINYQTGAISYMNSFDRKEITLMLGWIKNFKEQDEIYTKASFMDFEGLERYKLLNAYNNAVLAACEISTLDYLNRKVNQFEFVTWEKQKGSEGVHTGNYFGENYAAAIEDFAQRAGLINKDKLFSETEMLTIYSGLIKLQDLNEISVDQEKIIINIKDKISLDDITLTKDITAATETVVKNVLDHIIVAGDEYLSFKQQGLMPKISYNSELSTACEEEKYEEDAEV